MIKRKPAGAIINAMKSKQPARRIANQNLPGLAGCA